MNDIINVSTGEVKKGIKQNIFISNGIGSCIVVVAVHCKSKIAGMAHIMLPGKAPEKEKQMKTKYAENAIAELLSMLEIQNDDFSKIKVCLIGAGNVLRKTDDRICKSNISSIMKILKDLKLEISATALGGVLRRSVRFNVSTGKVYFTEGDSNFLLLHDWNLD